MPDRSSDGYSQTMLNGEDSDSDGEQLEGEVQLLSPRDVFDTLDLLKENGITPDAVMLDPWYNRGKGDVIDEDEYFGWLNVLLARTYELTDHVFLWGYPDSIWRVLPNLPESMELIEWLTWYYKNRPSVDDGWRSSQFACLHLGHPDAKMHPEHFLTEEQLQKKEEGTLRYMPGPPSVIEASLPIGFVKKEEQTDHPSQKPKDAIEPLVQMATQEGDLVLDPMSGSGTTGDVCREIGRNAILADKSGEYTEMVEKRLGITQQNEL